MYMANMLRHHQAAPGFIRLLDATGKNRVGAYRQPTPHWVQKGGGCRPLSASILAINNEPKQNSKMCLGAAQQAGGSPCAAQNNTVVQKP
jgi:hypothetical protein